MLWWLGSQVLKNRKHNQAGSKGKQNQPSSKEPSNKRKRSSFQSFSSFIQPESSLRPDSQSEQNFQGAQAHVRVQTPERVHNHERQPGDSHDDGVVGRHEETRADIHGHDHEGGLDDNCSIRH